MALPKLHLFASGTTNAKQSKDTGHKSYIMYLAPSDSAVRGKNVCPSTEKDNSCVKDCLYYCGRGLMPSVVKARTDKTTMMWYKPRKFNSFFVSDHYAIDAYGEEIGEKIFIRANGTSDMNFYRMYNLHANMFPWLIPYEYTKVLGHLYQDNGIHYTFSATERNVAAQIQALKDGYGVAKIYRGELPESDVIGGVEYRVIDGDASDLRPLDRERYNIPPLEGYIVGLRFKKPRRK